MKLAMVGLDKDLLDALGDRVVAIFDPQQSGSVWGIPVVGGDSVWADFRQRNPAVRPLLAIDPPALRRKLADHYGRADIAGFIADTAYISRSAQIAGDAVIQHRVWISGDVRIAEGARINIGAQLHHDCTIGGFATIAPRAALMGRVSLGQNVYVGAGAVIRQGVSVGADAVIGAGAVVLRDVGPNETVVGIPARPISREKA